jgi:hypothetical protein
MKNDRKAVIIIFCCVLVLFLMLVISLSGCIEQEANDNRQPVQSLREHKPFGESTNITFYCNETLDLSDSIQEDGSVRKKGNLIQKMNFSIKNNLNKTLKMKIDGYEFMRTEYSSFYYSRLSITTNNIVYYITYYYPYDYFEWIDQQFILKPYENLSCILSFEFRQTSEVDDLFSDTYMALPGTFLDGQIYQARLLFFDGSIWDEFEFEVKT